MLRRWIGPKNSLIVAFDTWESLALEELEDQLDHIEAYYRFVKLSALAQDVSKGTPSGLASIVFLHPRKGLFLKVLPELMSRSIPVTIFVDTELTGTNRLPPQEELAVYQTEYPKQMNEKEVATRIREWTSGSQLDPDPLLALLHSLGPFPVEKSNPLNYMATWGKIGEVPGSLREIGIRLSRPLRFDEDFVNQCRFIQQRCNGDVKVATGKPWLPSDETLKKIGIHAVITQRIGAVEKGVSVFDLPTFPLEKTGAVDENK